MRQFNKGDIVADDNGKIALIDAIADKDIYWAYLNSRPQGEKNINGYSLIYDFPWCITPLTYICKI